MASNAPPIPYDPVCGMRVKQSEFHINADFKGLKIYFCAETCREKFMADPHRFLKPKGWWRRYMDKLTRANEEQFGSKPPKCCG
jgi:YHS domain-containing protein